MWGDLWWTGDGLVRLSRGFSETRRAARDRSWAGGGPTVRAYGPADEPVSAAAIQSQVPESPRNRWVPLADIRAARLRQGRFASRLAIRLRDGTRVKLLWLPQDPAFDVLRTLLSERLGPDLRMR